MQPELPIPTTSVRNKESSSSNNLEIKQVLVNEVWHKKGGRALIVLALYCLKQGEQAQGGIGLYYIAKLARKCWLIRRQVTRSEYDWCGVVPVSILL